MSPDAPPLDVSTADLSPAAVDRVADKAGEPRPPNPPAPLPPPGTDRTKFWEAGATKAAIVSTVVLLNAIVRPYIEAKFGAVVAVLAEAAEWSWLFAFGIQKTDTGSLRWK